MENIRAWGLPGGLYAHPGVPGTYKAPRGSNFTVSKPQIALLFAANIEPTARAPRCPFQKKVVAFKDALSMVIDLVDGLCERSNCANRRAPSSAAFLTTHPAHKPPNTERNAP